MLLYRLPPHARQSNSQTYSREASLPWRMVLAQVILAHTFGKINRIRQILPW
jgi:hypothetical protein